MREDEQNDGGKSAGTGTVNAGIKQTEEDERTIGLWLLRYIIHRVNALRIVK